MKKVFHLLRLPLFAALLLLITALLTDELAEGQRAERRARLEEACRYAAVACYAAEGFYPPDLAWLTEHGNFSVQQAEEDGYVFFYQSVADNLMPEITVVDLHE